MPRIQTILVFDSGFGGLTVLKEVRHARPDAEYIYVADNAAFPYGALSEEQLLARVLDVFDALMAEFLPDLVVIACNTASTIVLPHLRAKYSVPFVGTVPAIKPAAQHSKSKLISVLGTPGTVSRDYTRELIDQFAEGCAVTLVGAPRLAAIAESKLKGGSVADAEILQEIRPCFIEVDGLRTDKIALACTHYPLLLEELHRLSPWPVDFIDPAPAIARRVVALLGMQQEGDAQRGIAVFTGVKPETPNEISMLAQYGLRQLVGMNKPLSL